ncbi:MAG: SWIM zinc finger family protein [Limnoraphis sp. WC205]|nr:SWIM zinc finger family protein [Limnoraphis sp. WC205]
MSCSCRVSSPPCKHILELL